MLELLILEINLKMLQILQRNNKFNSHNNRVNLNLLLQQNKSHHKFNKSLLSLLQMQPSQHKHSLREKLIFQAQDLIINKDTNKKRKNNNIVHKKIQYFIEYYMIGLKKLGSCWLIKRRIRYKLIIKERIEISIRLIKFIK